MAILKSLFTPAILAEYIPGSPLSASTHSPESSAKEVILDKFTALRALIKAFSLKLLPFSMGST